MAFKLGKGKTPIAVLAEISLKETPRFGQEAR